MKKKLYRAEVDVDWKGGGICAGEESDAIPAAHVGWLLECGAITEVKPDDEAPADEQSVVIVEEVSGDGSC